MSNDTAPREIPSYPVGNSECGRTVSTETLVTDTRERTLSVDEQVSPVDEEWVCPHPQLDDHDACVFHAVPEDREDHDVGEALLRALDHAADCETRAECRRHQRFLSGEFVRDSEIDTVLLRNATVQTPLDIRGATLDGLLATNADCRRLYAHEVEIGDRLVFEQATLDRVYLTGARSPEETPATVNFYQASVEYGDFPDADIDRGNFMYADLEEVGFTGATFRLITFFGADFGSLYLNDFEAEYLNFHAVSGGSLHLDGDVAAATFRSINARSLRLSGSSFDRLRMDKAEVDSITLSDADLGVVQADRVTAGQIDFDGANIDHALDLSEATVGSLELDPETYVSDDTETEVGYVDLREASVEDGTIAQPGDERVLFDLEAATVGDVRLEGHSDDYLTDLLILQTRFDGFDFEQLLYDHQALELSDNEYKIHEIRCGAAAEVAVLRELQTAAADVHAALERYEIDALGARAVENAVDFDHEGLTDPEDTTRRALRTARERAVPDDRLRALDPAAPLRPATPSLPVGFSSESGSTGATSTGETGGTSHISAARSWR
ncbi:hypothetical protein BRD18_02355 [Halobacteriales archaeon SW_7_71_33]|nr:MAG: hypothetical protein BRD18_02355 [Halobacteriales archaeon SW_7_71_33]